jgi:hypothetical protein
MARDHPPPFVPLDAFLGTLRKSLGSRVEYWKGEARRYVASVGVSQNQITVRQSTDEPETAASISPDRAATERKNLLLDFKAKARAVGIRATDEMIAKAANPGRWNDRTPVAWWKRCDPNCTPAYDKRIRDILSKDPASLWPER